MSKTTNKLGKPLYTAHLSIAANPVKSERAIAERIIIEEMSVKHFNKSYDKLTDKQKSELHFNLNTGVYDESKSS